VISWKIFSHSLNMVLRNWRDALRIALVPVLIGVVLFVAFLGGLMSEAMHMDANGVPTVDPALAGPLFLAAVVFIILELWVFVNWHRFVLLEEYPQGWIPPFRGGRILAYIGVSLILALVMGLVAAVVIGMVVMMSAAVFPPVIAMILAIAAFVFVGVFLFRLLPMLPAAAIGERLSMSQSLQATRGTAGTAIMLFVVLILVQLLLQFIVGASMMVFAPLGFIFSLGAALVMTLVNVSILTTLYGHYVQGRPI